MTTSLRVFMLPSWSETASRFDESASTAYSGLRMMNFVNGTNYFWTVTELNQPGVDQDIVTSAMNAIRSVGR